MMNIIRGDIYKKALCACEVTKAQLISYIAIHAMEYSSHNMVAIYIALIMITEPFLCSAETIHMHIYS